MLKVSDFLLNLSRPVLRNFCRNGSLEVLENGYPLVVLGDGEGPSFTISVKSPMTLWKMISDPDLVCGELYVDGEWEMVEGDLGAMLSWLCRNNRAKVNRLPPPAARRNDSAASRKNVAHHYDLGNDLYECFLDSGMNYSCAFFDHFGMTLEDAQRNKLCKTIQRAAIAPGMRVLDIGCGWGGLAHAVSHAVPGAQVTGITLSDNQLVWAQECGMPGKDAPRFLLADYRDHARFHAGAYDRIVSVGMFEHVGRAHYDEFFASIARMLKPGSKALVHSIMRPEAGDATSRWIDTYIFPGGSIPYLPDALESAARQGLSAASEPYLHDGTNYAQTLRCWRRNFNENGWRLDPMHYDRRFKRLWNYYLASCEAAFDGMGYFVAQMPLQKAG